MGVLLFTLPLIGDVTLATAVGVLSGVASFLLRPHQQDPAFKAMSSAWGTSWPIVYNNARVAGQIIQCSDVSKHKKFKKAPSFSQTFALGVCEGVRNVGRIWADNQVIYDPRPIIAPPAWQADTNYGAGDIIQNTGGGGTQFTALVDGLSGSTEPSWNFGVADTTADNEEVWIASAYTPRTAVGQQYNFTMRIYNGTETQLQDSALEALVGVGNQAAYRGLVYIVFQDFDLSKYGNRIPGLEVEILQGNAGGVTITFDPDSSPLGNGAQTANAWVNPTGTTAWQMATTLADDAFTLTKNSIVTRSVVATQTYSASWSTDPTSIVSGPKGSYTGSDLFVSVGNDTNNLILKIDPDTLNILNTYSFTATPLSDVSFAKSPYTNSQMAINGDGAKLFGISTDLSDGTNQYFLVMDLTTGSYTWDKISDIVGMPANTTVATIISAVFDSSGNVWMTDINSNIYEVSISGTTPTFVASYSVPEMSAYDQVQNLGYDPSTGELIVWLQNVYGDGNAFFRWDTSTHALTTPVYTTPANNAAIDGSGWNSRGYAAGEGDGD